jgi:hypothetical protein
MKGGGERVSWSEAADRETIPDLMSASTPTAVGTIPNQLLALIGCDERTESIDGSDIRRRSSQLRQDHLAGELVTTLRRVVPGGLLCGHSCRFNVEAASSHRCHLHCVPYEVICDLPSTPAGAFHQLWAAFELDPIPQAADGVSRRTGNSNRSVSYYSHMF